jgi:hypothetical protein
LTLSGNGRNGRDCKHIDKIDTLPNNATAPGRRIQEHPEKT